MISIVSPIYNEESSIEELCQRVSDAMERSGENFEFILVDNGSSDRSLEIIKNLRKKDKRIKFISLSRNFGHQGGILAGLAKASGGAVISIDGDLQHPPELIPTLIELWRQGNDIVSTAKIINSSDGWLRLNSRHLFYKIISLISNVTLKYGQSDFRLIDRKIVDVLIEMQEKSVFLRGLVEWVGFKKAEVVYEPHQRKEGKTKFSFMEYINFAMDGILSFSTIPLKLFLFVGLIISCLSLFWAMFYFFMGIANLFFWGGELLPPGSASISVGIFFLGGVQLIGIGVLGEYIGRIFKQTKNRPSFIINEKEL